LALLNSRIAVIALRPRFSFGFYFWVIEISSTGFTRRKRAPVKYERDMKNGLGSHSETLRYIRGTITGHMKGIDMKSSALAIAIVAALTVSASIVSKASAETEQQKANKVHRLNKDIRHDNRDLRKDKGKLAHDRAERNYDQMRENRAIEHGNVKGAEKWDQQRRAEQGQVNADKKDIRKDERDLNKDRADRNADVQDRNRAASGL
jgi:hypothetical protein